MSSTVSVYDFTAARRGYAPEQVERAVSALVAQRDEAWQRLSILGSRFRDLETELAVALRAAADAPPPQYQDLGARAAGILAMAEEQAALLREEAQQDAQQARDTANERGDLVTREADEAADAVRLQADQEAEQCLERARTEAAKLCHEAAHDTSALLASADQGATVALEGAQEIGKQTEAELAAWQRAADEEWAAADSREQEVEDRITALGERRMRDAAQHREMVLTRIREVEEEAAARVDRVIQRAYREAERIAEGVERDQEAYAERQVQVQAELDHIRQALAAITGGLQVGSAAVGPPARSVPSPAAELAPGIDRDCETTELPLPFGQYRECPADEDRYFG